MASRSQSPDSHAPSHTAPEDPFASSDSQAAAVIETAQPVRLSIGHAREMNTKKPRLARFAEAVGLKSPPPVGNHSPHDSSNSSTVVGDTSVKPSQSVADVGFGFVADSQNERLADGASDVPDKSLRSPGANPLSPTYREEQILEHYEKATERVNAKEVRSEKRVRIARFFLRGINFSCSLIVLCMLATTMHIFNATKSLTARGTAKPWSPKANPWPQILLLVISSLSLLMCLVVLINYFRGRQRRAEKVAFYYTCFSAAFFFFCLVLWVVAAACLQHAHTHSNNMDIWGWACTDNTRSQLYGAAIDYSLVCRMQDWALVCVCIEIVLELLTLGIYGVYIWRYLSMRKLRKAMDVRDQARSDLYMSHVKNQTAPNTAGFPMSPLPGSAHPFSPGFPRSPGPGFGPRTPAFPPFTYPGMYPAMYPGMFPLASPGFRGDPLSVAEKGAAAGPSDAKIQYATPKPLGALHQQTQDFKLQPAPPARVKGDLPAPAENGVAAPAVNHSGQGSEWKPVEGELGAGVGIGVCEPPGAMEMGNMEHVHAEASPGEQQYDSVPIPSAY